MSNARLESAVREPGHICCTVFPVQQLKSSFPEQPFILTRRRQEQIAVGTADGQLFVRDRAGAVVLKNRQDEALQGDTGAGFGPEGKSSWQLNGRDVVNLKYQQDEAIQAEVPARSVPGKKSSLQQRGGSHNCKITTRILAQPALEAEPDPVVIKELRNNKTETPYVVSAAADAVSQESVDQDQRAHLEMQGPASPAAPSPHHEPASQVSAPPILQVPIAQLEQWRADVAERHQAVSRAQVAYARASEALEQCSPGGAGWGEQRRKQRYLEHQLEAETDKLDQFTRFVTLIEQGATSDEACAAVLGQQGDAIPAEQSAERGASPEEAMGATPPVVSAEPRPRLEGQVLRQALFATLARLFTSGDPRHVELERGKFNRAIKNLAFAGLQPDDLAALVAAFERLWPKATCTALALANNLPKLMGTAESMGWQFQAAALG